MGSKRVHINWRSVKLTWLMSYLVVLTLPLFLGALVYRESSQALKSEIHAANETLLKQIRETMENYFQSMQLLNTELTWNVKVQELLYSNKYQTRPNEYMYDQYEIVQELKRQKNAYTSVDLFYIFLKRDDEVLLPGTTRQGEGAYKLLHQSDQYSYSQWLSLLDKQPGQHFVPMVRINEEGQSVQTVSLISPYRQESGNPVAANVVMIDQSRLLGLISNVEIFNKGHVLILNSQNEVLISSSNLDLPDDIALHAPEDDIRPFYEEIAGERYEVSYLRSEHSGLQYISLIPSRIFWEKAEHIRRLSYLSVLVSLLGGGILTYVFLSRNYYPVRRLVHAFIGKSQQPNQDSYNEFSFLEQAVDRTFNEMQDMMRKMGQHQDVLRSNFIARLLRGKVDGHIPLDESLSAFSMTFASDEFAVLLLYAEESERFFANIPNVPDRDKEKLLSFIITNVVEEQASRSHHGYVTEIGDTLACLISLRPGEREEQAKELQYIAQEAQTFLDVHYKIQLTVAISSIRSGLTGISQAYADALDAMEYKLVMGSKEIIAYEQVCLESSAEAECEYYYPLQVEQQLITLVKLGDFGKAKELLDQIIQRNCAGFPVSIPLAKCLMMNLVSTLLKTQEEFGDVQESLLIRNPRRLERLTDSETIQDMQQQLTELLQEICQWTAAKRQSNIQQARQRAIDQLTREIIGFIESRYQDPNLNISMIGAHFNKKAAYLSKLFKDHTSEGLLEFINKVRIEHSKQLMGPGQKSVHEVAQCVGFNDVNVFIRVFKRHEGVTPGKYKEMQEP